MKILTVQRPFPTMGLQRIMVFLNLGLDICFDEQSHLTKELSSNS